MPTDRCSACMLIVWRPIRRHPQERTPKHEEDNAETDRDTHSLEGNDRQSHGSDKSIYIHDPVAIVHENLKHCIYDTPVRGELNRSPVEAVSCIASTDIVQKGTRGR